MKTPHLINEIEMHLVFTFGKVGSLAIYYALLRAGCDDAHHLHFLSHDREKELRSELYRDLDVAKKIADRNAELRIKIERRISNGEPIKIISAVREPVEHFISAFFENIDTVWPQWRTHYQEDGPATIAALRSLLMKHLDIAISGNAETLADRQLAFIYTHHKTWFEREMLPFFGIDVFKYDFDIRTGCITIKNGNIELLIYRFEDMPRIIEPALKEFVGRTIPIIRENVGEQERGAIYPEFLRSVSLRRDYLASFYESRMARHFYTDMEIEKFSKRWQASADV
jgi:hypothetical protein